MNTRKLLFEHQLENGTWIRVVQGDLTREPVDAIVNAANEHLAHGGGLAGAIVRAGGKEIQRQSRQWVEQHGPVPTGSAAITGAGRLPCRYVIHAVGPVWRNRGDEDELLARAVISALACAQEHDVQRISLPAISTGIFCFPKERGARVIVEAVRQTAKTAHFQEVNLTAIDAATATILAAAAREILE